MAMVGVEEKEKISTKRWMVTYTKHMKQKRKIYQDGALELCSSNGKPQIILYDDCEKTIDRRFLKRDEIVKLGATISFETHIVDIGELDGNKKPSAESNVKPVIQSEAQKKKLCVEWNVLYTMHVTQKAKKYHDGILRVLICNPNLNLVTLLNEDGAILSSKHLKSLACLETGKNCEFPNYLVEICERRASVAGQDKNVIENHSIEFEDYSNVRSLCKDLRKKYSMTQDLPTKPGKCGKLVTSKKDCQIPIYSVPKKETSGWRTSNARASAAPSNLPKDHSKKVTNDCNSKGDSFSKSSTATLRDAWQILSVLKRPVQERIVLSDPLVDQGCTSKSSGLNAVSTEKNETSACYGLKSITSRNDSISTAHLVLDADCEGISSENDQASSIWSSCAAALDTSPTKCNINNNGGHTSLTTEVLEVSYNPKLPGSGQTNKPDKTTSDIGLSPEGKPIFPLQNSLGALNGEQNLSASTSSLLKDNLDANERSSLHGTDTSISSDSTPDQLYAKLSQTDERNESVSFTIVVSTAHATSDATKDPVIPSSVELANLEDFPTFDLVL